MFKEGLNLLVPAKLIPYKQSIKINYLDTGLTPQKRTTIHTRSIKLKNIIIFYNTHAAMQPKAKMHMNIFQVLQHTYMKWFCYRCILHPWCIKIPKDAKKNLWYMCPVRCKDWLIDLKMFLKNRSCLCDFCCCSCGCYLMMHISFSLCCTWQ